MDLADLAEAVGAERFERASAMAWATAKDTGKGFGAPWPRPDGLEDVPHELADVVEGDLELAFALFRAMPCYANLMYVGHWGVGPGFWAELRALLDDADPRPAAPALYWLWCGPFEAGGGETATAWREMSTGAGNRRLRRLLGVSGPVPWRLKAPLLESLAATPRWHAAVHGAVERAVADLLGDVDGPAAQRLLRRIGRPDSEIRRLLGPRADDSGR